MELACNLLVNDIRKKIDNVVIGGVIYLDISKAFDTVSHWCLLLKLLSYGINGIEFTWFENYLFNQKQHVFYNGHLSKAIPVFISVLQGSILGPTLFYSIWTTLIKYADDTEIYVSGNDSESIQKKLKSHILEVHNWLTNNVLLLNFIRRPVIKKGKTESMILAPKFA